MEDSLVAVVQTSNPIGARFKAGLQSVLNSLQRPLNPSKTNSPVANPLHDDSATESPSRTSETHSEEKNTCNPVTGKTLPGDNGSVALYDIDDAAEDELLKDDLSEPANKKVKLEPQQSENCFTEAVQSTVSSYCDAYNYCSMKSKNLSFPHKNGLKTDKRNHAEEKNYFISHSSSTTLVISSSSESNSSPEKPLSNNSSKSSQKSIGDKSTTCNHTETSNGPVTGVYAQRASPHVSPSNTDDENEELVLGAASTEELSDDDLDGSCKSDIHNAEAPDNKDRRLKKLITQLSVHVDSNANQNCKVEDPENGFIRINRQHLVALYNKVVKSEVIQDTLIKDLNQKHSDIKSKSNTEAKKISQILEEVKGLRDKVKAISIRPMQRCVSTQIVPSERLDSLPEPDTTVKTLKSRVMSQKLTEPPPKMPELTPTKNFTLNTGSTFTTEAKKPADSEVIDLTSEEEPKNVTPIKNTPSIEKDSPKLFPSPPNIKASIPIVSGLKTTPTNSLPILGFEHPAPLPPCPLTGKPGPLTKPPPPSLELTTKQDGIILQWNMVLTKYHAKVSTYQIFGYKERPGPATGNEWKKVGDLKALPLPMACTLTQFQTGHTYHFSVRAIDELGRTGPFAPPKSTKLP